MVLGPDAALFCPVPRREDLSRPSLALAWRAIQVQVKAAQSGDSDALTCGLPASLPPRATLASASGPQPAPQAQFPRLVSEVGGFSRREQGRKGARSLPRGRRQEQRASKARPARGVIRAGTSRAAGTRAPQSPAPRHIQLCVPPLGLLRPWRPRCPRTRPRPQGQWPQVSAVVQPRSGRRVTLVGEPHFQGLAAGGSTAPAQEPSESPPARSRATRAPWPLQNLRAAAWRNSLSPLPF